jgi:HEAT repeat protein
VTFWVRRPGWHLVLAGFLLSACSTPEEKLTPAQFVSENSTLLQQLASYRDSEQREGITRLERLGKDQGSAVILYILGDPKLDSYRVEVVLARVLAEWKDPRAAPYLLRNLTVPDRGAASRAAEGLVALGDLPQIMAALEELLARPATEERAMAAETLARISSPRVPEIFLARWPGEPSAEIRGLFLVTIIRSRHPRRKAFLIDALTDADAAIRNEAWAAVRRYPDLPRLEFDPDGPVEDRARQVAALRMWVRAPPAGAK